MQVTLNRKLKLGISNAILILAIIINLFLIELDYQVPPNTPSIKTKHACLVIFSFKEFKLND